MVPAGSDRVSRARPYSGTCPARPRRFAYGTLTRCGAAFHPLPLRRDFVTRRPAGRRSRQAPTTPGRQRLPSITSSGPWALPFSLATTQGVEVSFLSSGYLDVSVPQLASTCPMDSDRSTRALPRVSFLIRRSRDQRSVSTSPGLSQPPTSFIGSGAKASTVCPCSLDSKEYMLMSLWSFQGARELTALALHESRNPSRGSVLQNSTACEPRLPDGDRDHETRSTLF